MMQKFCIYRHHQDVEIPRKGAVVAIGNFDGMHRGHQSVLQEAKEKAEKDNLSFACITFEPHPKAVFMPESPPSRLTPFACKARLMKEAGVEILYVIRFSREYAKTTAIQFVQQTLKEALQAKQVVIGDDFAFGKGREGSPEMLQKLGGENGFEVKIMPQLEEAGSAISSTRIRKMLEEGDVEQAHALLGQPFELKTWFYESKMLSLVGNISRYVAVKNGAYWAQVDYNSRSCVVPVSVKDGWISIPPLANRPAVKDKRAAVRLMEKMEQLNAVAG